MSVRKKQKQKHDFLFFFVLCIIKQLLEKNQGLGKGYQPQPSASADNPYLDIDYSR